MTAYLTPSDLWRLARPGSCSPSEFEPGAVTQGAPTRTGSGTLLVGGAPIDAWAGRVVAVTTGEPTGQFGGAVVRVSTDGVNYGPAVVLGAPGVAVDVPYTGLTLTATAGAAPSFVAGDLWPFATTAGPEFIAAIEAASRAWDTWLRDTYALPLKSWDDDLRRRVAVDARQILLEDRGMKDAAEHFRSAWLQNAADRKLIAEGTIQLGVVEGDGGVVFPSFCKPRPKYATDWRA